MPTFIHDENNPKTLKATTTNKLHPNSLALAAAKEKIGLVRKIIGDEKADVTCRYYCWSYIFFSWTNAITPKIRCFTRPAIALTVSKSSSKLTYTNILATSQQIK